MKKTVMTFAALTLAAACAQGPDSIMAVPMGDIYSGLSCNQAITALNAERATLSSLSNAQRAAATGDTIGVLLIGLPISSISGGDKVGDIATSKGKIQSLEARIASC